MKKSQFNTLVKKAVRYNRLEFDGFDQIMDEAAMTCDTDEEWGRFIAAVEEGSNVPLTPREQKMVDNRKKRVEIERARTAAENSQRYYQSLIRAR